MHDFPDKVLGKVTPNGVFDLMANQGWVSVGTDHDTAAFAVDTVRRWGEQMGAPLYAGAATRPWPWCASNAPTSTATGLHHQPAEPIN